MVQNLNTKIALILVVVIAAVYVIFFHKGGITEGNVTLGLDLSGGSSLRYKLPAPDSAGGTVDMDQIRRETIEVFRKRIDSVGLKEIPIYGQGEDEILIELPGMSEVEVESIIQIIQTQGILEWLLVAEDETDPDDTENSFFVDKELDALTEYLEQKEADEGGWSLESDLSPLDRTRTFNEREALFRWLPNSPATLERSGVFVPEGATTFNQLRDGLGAAAPEDNKALVSAYFRMVKIFKDPKWRFSGQDLIMVRKSSDEHSLPAVGFEFKPAGGNDFSEFTEAHIKKGLAIVLDGKVITTPIIQSVLPGSGIISGPKPKGFLPHEQEQLITVLKSGSVSVRPILLSRHHIGPTLGKTSIERGQTAAMVGLSAVFVFIIAYYFLAGLVASISLAINLGLLLAVLIFLEATLTLPGFAGIVLTVGMAVDANILIFERIREEKDKGKTIAQALKNGFERAFLTIVDANATTFITGFILFSFGTGPIKGFAVTLMIGIVTSLFSALLVSKVILAVMLERGLQKLNMFRILKEVNVDFLTMRTKAAFISVILIIVGIVLLVLVSGTILGLDFTGGYNVQLVCKEGVSESEVRSALGSTFSNLQVIPVMSNAAAESVGTDTAVYNIKIKGSGASDEDSSSSPDFYREQIEEAMGDKLVGDPISGLELTPKTETETTAVKAVLHFVEPPATAAQLEALGDGDPATVYKENLASAFGDFIKGDAYIFSDGGRTLTLVAEYTRSASITKERFKAGLVRQLEIAQKNGLPVGLTDPFPVSDQIGASVGVEMMNNAVKAIFLALVAIIVYIRLRFKEYKYGFAACTALVHDVAITVGAISAAHFTGFVDIEIDLPIIAAFMTIIGYSLNDTIVVFDRIRENLPRMSRPFNEVLNVSINQTLARTILTSTTTLIVLIILFAINYGQRNVLEGFSFAMIIGVIVGTYSSIFVASPALLMLHNREAKTAGK